LDEVYNKTIGYGWVHLDGTSSDAKLWLKIESDIDEIWVDALLAIETRPRLVKIDNNTIFINLRGVLSFNNEEPEDMISIRLYVTKQQIISVKIINLKAITKLKMDF
jgi:zinc transporter